MPPRTRGGYTSSAPRRRPTGSERRRRVQLREVEPAADPDSVEHPQHDRDEHEEVFEGAPGGPIDRCILRSFDRHIAANIWLGEVNAPLPGLTRMADPNRVLDARPCTGTLYLLN